MQHLARAIDKPDALAVLGVMIKVRLFLNAINIRLLYVFTCIIYSVLSRSCLRQWRAFADQTQTRPQCFIVLIKCLHENFCILS